MAGEMAWKNYLSRDNSMIVDLFQVCLLRCSDRMHSIILYCSIYLMFAVLSMPFELVLRINMNEHRVSFAVLFSVAHASTNQQHILLSHPFHFLCQNTVDVRWIIASESLPEAQWWRAIIAGMLVVCDSFVEIYLSIYFLIVVFIAFWFYFRARLFQSALDDNHSLRYLLFVILGRHCPKCNCYRDARSRIGLWRLPRYLIVHLKRFYFDGPFRDKINTMVR